MSTEKNIELKKPVFFKNKDWSVTKDGIEHNLGKVDYVSWEEINQVLECSVRTIYPFYVEAYPFRALHKEADFDKEAYSDAFRYALGYLAMKRWNKKAVEHYVALYPEAQ